MSTTKKKTTQSKKKTITFEFSKALCIAAVIIFTCVAIFTIGDYYALMRLAITKNSTVTPDASLPIASITSIIGVVLSYCLYQGILKSSLNKNQLTIDDNGMIKPVIENIVKEESEKESKG